MYIFLPLTNPTAVARTGATKTWSLSAGPALPGTNGTFLPGDKGLYLRLKIQPATPLTFMPSQMLLSVTATYAPTSTGTHVVYEVQGIGPSTGPTTPYADGYPVNGLVGFAVDTSGLNLAQLNAGNLYVWLAYRADPTTYGGTVSVTPTSPVQVDGGLTATSNPTFSISANPTSGSYLVVNVTVGSTGEGTVSSGGGGASPLGYTGTASVNNGQGASDSGPIAAPSADDNPAARFASNTVKYLIPTGSPRQISPTGTASLSTAASGNFAQVTHTVSTSVVTPDASTLTLSDVQLAYQPPVPPLEGAILPPFAFGGAF